MASQYYDYYDGDDSEWELINDDSSQTCSDDELSADDNIDDEEIEELINELTRCGGTNNVNAMAMQTDNKEQDDSQDDSYTSSEDDSQDEASTSLLDPEPCSLSPETNEFSDFLPTKPQKHSTKSSGRFLNLPGKIYLVLLPLLLMTMMAPFPTVDFGDGLESIYVPGVGFSGFWFTLGRLKSIKDPSSKHFVCFSAGCLGAVTILNEFSVEEMACMAETAQTAFWSGDISRFEVVSQFVDGLVYRNFPSTDDPLNCLGSLHGSRNTSHVPIGNPYLMSMLHILTTEKADGFGVKAAMRTPTSLDELREMLIQTAWIPLATGNGLMHEGHLDGGFSLWQHPRCTKSVNLPLDAGLILNSLNVNMGIDEAYRLWYDGLAYGL